MSDRIRVDWEQMEDVAAQLKRLSGVLGSIQSKIRGVRIDQTSGAELRLSFATGRMSSTAASFSSGTVEECLWGIAGCTGSLNEHAQKLSGKVSQAAELFAVNEMQLVHDFGGVLTPEEIMRLIGQTMGIDSDPGSWTPQLRDDIISQMKDTQALRDEDVTFLIKDGEAYILGPGGLIAKADWTQGLTGLEINSELYVGDGRLKTELDVGLIDGGLNFEDDILKRHELFSEQGTYDPATGETTEGKLNPGVGIGLFSIGATASASYSALSESASAQYGNLKGEVTAGVGNAQASAGVQGGLGLYVGPDGKTYVQAGVQAQAGASVSAANVQASMSYELCDNVSLGVEGEVSVLEAEGKAGIGVGVVNGEVMAYAEASAEINLVEANVEGSVDLGGVEGKVGASVSVGVGAHAKAGYKDGVISFDVGASVGVGVSVNAEIDVSGLVNAAGEAYQAVSEGWNKFCSWLAG